MRTRKHSAHSDALGRVFHADLFELGPAPTVVVLQFGGSGVTAAKYWERATTRVAAFDDVLARLEVEGMSLAFAFVTAPFDLGYALFHQDPAAAARWTRHVAEDLLALWPDLPVFLQGYSGGIELAIRGPTCYRGV